MLLLVSALLVILVCLWKALSALNRYRQVLYLDESIDSQVFESHQYRIRAKPDLLRKADDGTIILVEFKSRQQGFYQSDRTQLNATALVLRENGLKVNTGILQTANGKQHRIDLSASDKLLYDNIEPSIAAARSVASGQIPNATPSIPKCRSCAYRKDCPYAAAH